MKILIEKSESKDIITDEEVVLKRDLIAILKDDGHGNHHALYAKVLENFPVKIVPVEHPIKTAAIDLDEKVIYFNRGFFRDKETFYQLQVIVRHELLHLLLDHQIRQVAYFQKNIPEAHLKLSSSLHSLCNTLEDFEISNRKYTEWDKSVVRNTKINGKIISGLVTEDHRDSWKNLTLEEMLNKLDEEMAEFKYSGKVKNETDAWGNPVKGKASGNLASDAAGVVRYKYQNPVSSYDSVKQFKKSLEKQIKKSRGPQAKMFDEWVPIFDVLGEKIKDYSKEDLMDLINKIKESDPKTPVSLNDKNNQQIIVLYTPEEKSLGIEVISIILNKFNYQDDYDAWYKEIMNKLSDKKYSEKDIKRILNALK